MCLSHQSPRSVENMDLAAESEGIDIQIIDSLHSKFHCI